MRLPPLFRYVGDCQMKLALRNFVEEHGKEIVEKNLYRNFVLHCCNLFEFGVVGQSLAFSAIVRMQRFFKEHNLKVADSKRIADDRAQWMKLNAAKASNQRKDFSGIFRAESKAASNEEKTPPPSDSKK